MKQCQAERSLDADGESGGNRSGSCERSGNRLDKSGRQMSGEGTESGAGGWRILKRSGTGKRRTGSIKQESKAAGERELEQSGREMRSEEENRVGQARLNSIQFPVTMARGSHLFPYRTQKLSLSALMVLGWKRPGRVGRRRIPF